MIHPVLSIAGSDPSGGAGIQADLKTFSSLKVYGMAVITALTAQNTVGVSDVMEVPAGFVAAQLDSVFVDIQPVAIKTGMLATAAIVELVADRVGKHRIDNLVVDPVLVSSSGKTLLASDALDVLKTKLLPLAAIVTPNLHEAAALTGLEVRDVSGMEVAARRLHESGAASVLVKGGHLEGAAAVDVFFDGKTIQHFRSSRVVTRDLHGTGCVLSAAIAAYLARGHSVEDAAKQGKSFVTKAIEKSLRLGQGSGPVNAG
jgi:hydroxymethylpyrimidine/phosphomethylpyrimidine kinase